MGEIDTNYTFTATDVITSTKMNNILDQSTITATAVFNSTLSIASGKLLVAAGGITSNELAANAVKTIAIEDNAVITAKILDANVTQAKLGPNVVGNGPTFRAYANTQTILPPNGFTKIILGAETFDTNSNFDSSRFTPTVAGYYQINATFSTVTTSALGVLSCIRKNGSDYALGSGQVNAAAIRSTVSDVVYLNGSTDYVELFGFHGSSINISSQTDSATTFMSGCLIRSA